MHLSLFGAKTYRFPCGYGSFKKFKRCGGEEGEEHNKGERRTGGGVVYDRSIQKSIVTKALFEEAFSICIFYLFKDIILAKLP